MRDIGKYEKEYCNTDFEQKYMTNYRCRKVLEILDKYKPASILEVGCGMNSVAESYNDYREFTIVEPGELFLSSVKTNLEKKTGITYIQGFMEDNMGKLQKKSYDFIIVSSLLHEVEEPMQFLKKINSLCNENTVVHINVPNELSMHRIIAYESGLIECLSSPSERNVLLQQNTVFNLKTLQELIGNSGKVRILETGSYFIKPFTHNQMDKCIENRIISEQILDGFYNMVKYMPEYGAEIFCNYRVSMGDKYGTGNNINR